MSSKEKQNRVEIGRAMDEYQKTLVDLPLEHYRTGDTILADGSFTGRLLILKKGMVVILREGVEIARVDKPGAVFGEISALLGRPHAAEVRALSDVQFYAAEATLLKEDPKTLCCVAEILAQRLIAADERVVELKKQLRSEQSPGGFRKILDEIEAIIRVGDGDFKQWM